jgi:tagatose-6-phosphate ketose/aldose isomerase
MVPSRLHLEWTDNQFALGKRLKNLMDRDSSNSQASWDRTLVNTQSKARELLGPSEAEQKQLGYFHTLHEICQQPWTWLRTSERMIAERENLQRDLAGIRSLVLTGSGSSEYAGECVKLALQNGLGIWSESIGAGILLTHGKRVLPKSRPALLISLARSGDSPESRAAIQLLLDTEPQFRHIIVTCNEQGSLTKAWRNNAQVRVITLPPETNDESLVMTSSFTNLVLAARYLGMLDSPDQYRLICQGLGQIAQDIIQSNFDALAAVGTAGFQRAVFLGSGSHYAGTREAALKMLEMTAGRVTTLCETYLAFRHGPMSYIQEDTLIVCNLSSDATLRAYELDLLRELDRKKLGLSKLIVGERIPSEVLRKGDLAIECTGLGKIGDEDSTVIDVLVAQLLAFFRCRAEGLRPDSPSEDGVIQRVVGTFPLHSSS